MEVRKLKVGDRVYHYRYGLPVSLIEIGKVTEKMAQSTCGALKFHNKIDPDGYVYKPRTKCKHYIVENEKLRRQFWRASTISKIIEHGFNNLSDDQLQVILSVIKVKTK